jgi:2-haloalkanoic acid dehalogenase type II
MAGTRAYDVVTFDCYGTLIDWERGIATAFGRASRAAGIALDRAAVLAAYHDVEPAVQSERYRRYRDVLAEAAERVAARLGWRLEPAQAAFLPASLPEWPPFPDAPGALARLAGAGYRLAILSNVDEDLLAESRRHLGVPFEFWVTAEAVGAYKPAPPHFDRARERVGERRWLHAAQSLFHDVAPARTLGIPVAWVNRKGERAPAGLRADREFRTLAELADWLAPAA